MSVVTPMQVEARLKDLSKLIDEAHDDLVNTESLYQQHKADYEIAMARTRLELSQKSSPTGKNYTVGEREDMALVQNAELHKIVSMDEAIVKLSLIHI